MTKTEILELLNTTEDQLIRHLDEDVRTIFSTMVGMEVSQSQPASTETVFTDCVTAMVGFAGSYSGMISINTSQKLAMYFTSQMLGMDVTKCNDDVHDALGEIANMIAGSFKHHFVVGVHEVQLSTPSVISGEHYFITVGSLPDTLTLMFEFAGDTFMVNVYLETGD